MDDSARSIVTPPPSASYSASESAGGARGLGNLVRPVSPPGTRFPGAVGRPGGQAGAAIGDHAIRAILGVRSPRSTPPSFPYLYLRTVNTHGITMNEV